MEEKFNDKNNYYIDGSWMIKGSGNEKIEPLKECLNTFLGFFWRDYFGGVGFWAQSSFLMMDIQETAKLFVELANKGEGELTIGMLSYMENIKTCSYYKSYYHNPMLHYDDEYHRSPIHCFHDIMELLNHNSIQGEFRKVCRESGLPPIEVIVC